MCPEEVLLGDSGRGRRQHRRRRLNRKVYRIETALLEYYRQLRPSRRRRHHERVFARALQALGSDHARPLARLRGRRGRARSAVVPANSTRWPRRAPSLRCERPARQRLPAHPA